jgi:hypothetical protein
MFEFYRSSDGCFGLVDDLAPLRDRARGEVHCPTCKARYKLLNKIDPGGAPVRKV